MKKKLSAGFAIVMAVMLLGVAALAAGLFTPSDSVCRLQIARDTLNEKYGITAELMGTYFSQEETREGDDVMFTFSPLIPPEDKIGQYVVTVKKDYSATAAWSLDKAEGERWTAKELQAAMERVAAGEEWWQITREEPVLEAAVSKEQAISVVKEQILKEYGNKLEGDWNIDAWLLYDNSEYSVNMTHDTKRGIESYHATVDAQSGKVIKVQYESAEESAAQNAKIDAEIKLQKQRTEEETAKAKALSKLSLEEGIAIAKAAVTETYHLTADQVKMLTSIEDEDIADILYRMDGETPLISCTFRLTQKESERTTGDGIYYAEVDAVSGEVVNIGYDTGLGGNG